MIKIELESGSSVSAKPAKVRVFENGKLVASVTAEIALGPCADLSPNEYIKLTQDVLNPVVAKSDNGDTREKILKSVEE